MSKLNNNTDVDEEFPFEENFVEQAEYLDPALFAALAIEHPEEKAILKKLMGGGAKLLAGPRGCGKSTLMLKAFHSLLENEEAKVLPIYVNFKLSLKIEPLYITSPNAPYWFNKWLVLRVFEAVYTVLKQQRLTVPIDFPNESLIAKATSQIEAGSIDVSELSQLSSAFLVEQLEKLLAENGFTRIVLLIDDAAHAFSEKQQEDFFDFFRSVKSKTISPKAAVYPGITSHSPTFHVGHDAEQIDVWVKPFGQRYEEFMLSMARKRFDGTALAGLERNREDLCFLAYAAFGIPRAFLGMLRTIYNSRETYMNADGTLSKNRVLSVARQGRAMSHAIFDSLNVKIPPYREYIINGSKVYDEIIQTLKLYNKDKPAKKQAVQFGISTPCDSNIEKVFQFLQYSGLIMPAGENMRGVKGTFALFDVHVGDLITENAIVGKRTKSVGEFLNVIRASRHQAWPRITSSSICDAADLELDSFTLSLPQCQVCGADRPSPNAKFCSNCGSQLKSSSVYETLVKQKISVLDISTRLQKRITENSNIRKVGDILIDSNREQLRGIKYIGNIRAAKIVAAAEEYLS